MTQLHVGGLGGGGGGGGFTLGPEQNVFGITTTASKAAAETLRNDYATANATWLAEYSADRSLWIQLVWTGNAYAIQRRNAAGTAWEDITGIIRGGTGPAGADATAFAIAFLESSTVPTAPTVTQDTSNALTFTGTWSQDYPANPSDVVYGVGVRYVVDDTARTIAATNVEGPFRITAVDGGPGPAGTPGGGAIDLVGTFTITIAAANDDIFLDMGFDWPVGSKWIPYTINGRAYWVDGDSLYGDNAITASTAGTASAPP